MRKNLLFVIVLGIFLISIISTAIANNITNITNETNQPNETNLTVDINETNLTIEINETNLTIEFNETELTNESNQLNETNTAEINETDEPVNEDNEEVIIIQHDAVLGKPVKWKKTIKNENSTIVQEIEYETPAPYAIETEKVHGK